MFINKGLHLSRGWENANYVSYPFTVISTIVLNANNETQVLGEVRDAPRTLRKAAPIAVIGIGILYILANIAYVSSYDYLAAILTWDMFLTGC